MGNDLTTETTTTLETWLRNNCKLLYEYRNDDEGADACSGFIWRIALELSHRDAGEFLTTATEMANRNPIGIHVELRGFASDPRNEKEPEPFTGNIKRHFFPQSTLNSEVLFARRLPTNSRSNVRVTTMAVNMLTATPINRVTANPITGALATILLPSQ